MNKKNNDPLSNALNINPLIVSNNQNIIDNLKINATDNSASNDFNIARENTLAIIENGKNAIEALSIIASQSQDIAAFDVLANIMKVMLLAQKNLLENHKLVRDIENSDKRTDENSEKNVTNNNLFVGSQAELLKLLNKKD